MEKKSILIYGLYDWCNLGDDLMMYEVNKKILEENMNPFFIRNDDDNYFTFERKYDENLFLNKKPNTFRSHKLFKYTALLKLIKKKNNYDALIFMGGGYINRSIGSGYGQLLYIYLLKTIFKLKGKKVYFTGQTIGPINNNIERLFIKKIYYNTNVAVREGESKRLLDKLRINNLLIGDDAFLSHNICANPLQSLIFNEKYIIVNYKDFSGYENIKNDFEHFLEDVYNKTKLKIVLTPFRKGQKYNEYKIHQEMMHNLKCKGVDVSLFETKKVAEINQLFALCEFVIATAYHAVVLGLKNNKKVYTGYIGQYYQTKMTGITSFYPKTSFNLYDLSINNIFKIILAEIDINKINTQNISLKLHNEVKQHWNNILKEIQDEKRK